MALGRKVPKLVETDSNESLKIIAYSHLHAPVKPIIRCSYREKPNHWVANTAFKQQSIINTLACYADKVSVCKCFERICKT